MMCQYGFISSKKEPSGGDADSGGVGGHCVCVCVGGLWDVSVPLPQFFCETENALVYMLPR